MNEMLKRKLECVSKRILERNVELYAEMQEMGTVIRRYELMDAEWERLNTCFPDRQAVDKGSHARIHDGL